MMSSFYLVFKCFHIIGVISWMAGLLYYFRLFVYHFEKGQNNESIHNLLALMEKRLYFFITVPAMTVSVIAGLLMVYLNESLVSARWFQVKLIFGTLMCGVTFYGLLPLENFRRRNFQKYSSRSLRVINEIPTIFMIVIVIMVIIRPF